MILRKILNTGKKKILNFLFKVDLSILMLQTLRTIGHVHHVSDHPTVLTVCLNVHTNGHAKGQERWTPRKVEKRSRYGHLHVSKLKDQL